MPSPTYSLIASTTLTGSQATVTFSSIPSTYTDLVLRCSTRTDVATAFSGGIGFVLNSSSVGEYSYTNLYGSGSAAGSDKGSSNAYWQGAAGRGDSAGNTANTFSSSELYIPNYNSSTTKPANRTDATENNTTEAYVSTTALLWNNTNAITSITVRYQGVTGNFVSGSTFYLYGIKSS